METWRKSNTEFRNEVTEILSRHDTSFDNLTNNYNQLNSTLQTVIIELQAIRINSCTNLPPLDVHLFTPGKTSNNTTSPPHQNSSNVMNDLTGWIYKAEQYFEFKSISYHQQVQLVSFHLEGIALQWHRWFTKFKGPLTWDEFTQALTVYQKKFLVSYFITGLRNEICLDVKIKQPSTLADTIGVARLIEERNQLQKTPSQPFCSQPTLVAPKANLNPTGRRRGCATHCLNLGHITATSRDLSRRYNAPRVPVGNATKVAR
ncbi:hypothetical protein ACOSQ4_020620 [Xanthoceras sorbifolium]